MDPLDQDRLDKLRALGIAPPPASIAPPAASPALPYNETAHHLQDQAGVLEHQAMTPYAEPHGLAAGLQAAVEGLAGGFTGGPSYDAVEGKRKAEFRQGQQDKLAQVKTLRSEANDQQKLGLTEEQRQIENRRADAGDVRAAASEERAKGQAAHQAAMDQATIDKLKQDGWKEAGDANGQYLVKADENQPGGVHKITIAGPKPLTTATKNQGFRDRVEGTHVMRDYFEQADPSKVTSTADLGEAKQLLTGGASGTVQVQFTGPNGPQVGVLNKKDGTITPATMAGDTDKKPVASASTGQLGQKELAKSFHDLQDAKQRLETMEQSYSNVTSGKSKNPGSDDMALLANHLSMTMGSVKGARQSREIIEAHRNAIPLGSRLRVEVEKVLTGEQLDPAQREEFLNLARNRVKTMEDSYNESENHYFKPAAAAEGAKPFAAPGGAIDAVIKKHQQNQQPK